HEGLDAFHTPAAPEGAATCGYIDKEGREVIPLTYLTCSNFSEGLADVETTERLSPDAVSPAMAKMMADLPGVEVHAHAVIDRAGAIVIRAIESFTSFHEGLAAIGNHYIDKTGKTVLSTAYNYVSRFSEGLAIVSTADPHIPIGAQADIKHGFIDKTGKLVIPVQLEEILGLWTIGEFQEGLAAVLQDGKFGFIDKTGKMAIAAKYVGVTDFSDGLAAVYSDANAVNVLSSPDPTQFLVGYIATDGTEYFEP